MSKLKIGDIVVFLNEKGGGVVCGFKNNEVLVRMENGMEIPYPENELIRTGHTPIFELSGDMDKNIRSENDFMICCALVPDSYQPDANTEWTFYILNHSDMNLYYLFSAECDKNKYVYLEKSECEPFQKKVIYKSPASDFESRNRFHLDIIFYRKNLSYPLVNPVSETIFINETMLEHANLTETPFFHLPVRIFVLKQWKKESEIKKTDTPHHLSHSGLTDEDIEKLKNFKNLCKNSSSISTKKENRLPLHETMEIDIHIEKICSQYKKMNPLEILNYQLSYFEQKLNEAMKDGYKKLLVIHGKGNGVLKKEIWKIIREEYRLKIEDSPYFYNQGGASIIFL